MQFLDTILNFMLSFSVSMSIMFIDAMVVAYCLRFGRYDVKKRRFSVKNGLFGGTKNGNCTARITFTTHTVP